MDFNPIHAFWFEECQPSDWFKKSDEFDEMITERFSTYHQAAIKGELNHWRDCAEGSLCEIIILDQFSRNIFRGKADAFASDPQALTLSQFAIEKGFDRALSAVERTFMYLPFMHSESLLIHDSALRLFQGSEQASFERAHRDILVQFNRYPHRNEALGRVSTAAELRFLEQENSGF